MIVLFIMTLMFSIYHTEIFYLVQIVFMLLDSIFVNIPFLYTVFLSGFLTNELRVTIYKLRVTSYYLLYELRVTFYIRVTSYYLLHELRVTF